MNNKYALALFVILCLKNYQTMAQCNTPFCLKIDHVLIAVSNLDSAKKEYENYGFTVVYGGDKQTALNALIFLEDGTLIELIGQDRFPSYFTLFNKMRITKLLGYMKDRISLFKRVKQPSLFNYSIYTSDISATHQYLKSTKVKCDKIISLTRKREDGVKIQWRLIGTYPYDLPFFISDYQPSRKSNPSFSVHENGVVSIDTLTILTTDFHNYYSLYNSIYRQKPEIQTINDALTCYYSIDKHTIVLKSSRSITDSFNKGNKSALSSLTLKSNLTKDTNSHRLNDFVIINYARKSLSER